MSKNYNADLNEKKEDVRGAADVFNVDLESPSSGKVVKAKILRVRKIPSLGSEVLCTINEGESATILEKLPEWYKISTARNIVGYVSAKYFMEV